MKTNLNKIIKNSNWSQIVTSSELIALCDRLTYIVTLNLFQGLTGDTDKQKVSLQGVICLN